MATSVKGHPVFAALYDVLTWPGERLTIGERRAALVGAVEGRVLDLGVGTGLNFPCYRRAAAVAGVDPDPYMIRQASARLARLRRARPRRDAAGAAAALIQAPAEALPFSEGAFDTVVATLVFCTVRDPAAALREVRRVLRPGGTLRFLEHVRAPSPRMAALQDRIQPLWSSFCAGCHPNRDTLAAIRAHGFAVEALETAKRGILIQGVATRCERAALSN